MLFQYQRDPHVHSELVLTFHHNRGTYLIIVYNLDMAQHALLSVSNTVPQRLTPGGTHSGLDITIQNVNASGYIYLGVDDSVSSTNYGYRILPNHAISFELPGKDALFIISSAPNMKAAVIKTNLENGS